MLHSKKLISTLDKAVDDFFTAYKPQLLLLSQAQWKSEDYRGKSYQQWTAMQYYNFLYLLSLMYREIDRTKNFNRDWTYYVSKYNLNEVQKCLGCYGIDWTKGLEAFGFNDLFPGGIENMDIESTFIISGQPLPVSDVSIKDLIANPYLCINYIKASGVNPVDLEHQPTTYFDTIQDTIDGNIGIVQDT
jgi:hypothetical protein